MRLVERAEQLTALVDQLEQVGDAGRLVLISGEAGAGKSALISTFCAAHLPDHRVLVGRCDDLFAPRPLGPLADIARQAPGPLGAALASGDHARAVDAFISDLSNRPHPTVVVLEDLQWADEATLDLLRYIARRLESIRCLVLATHRDGLSSDHPLRRAHGSLVGPLVTRLRLPPLSVDGVRTLVADRPIDPVQLHARTGGNPFFVTEVLAGGSISLPDTVRDAVLSRAALLPGPARDALEAAAVLGQHVRPELLCAVGDCAPEAVEACLAAGLLVDDGGRQTFRHDLAREAVEGAMTPLRRRQLHARALDALGDSGDVVHRANHAIGAGDGTAILALATQAGDHCVNLGAHSQAATLYGEALGHVEGLADPDRLRLLEAHATACRRVERFEDAIRSGRLLLAAADGDARATGAWEAWLGAALRDAGRTEEAWTLLEAAVTRLEPGGDTPELAGALALLAQQQMISGQATAAIPTGERAAAMAERLGLEEVAVHALDTTGTAMACAQDVTAGGAMLLAAQQRARAAGLVDELARLSGNLATVLVGSYQPAAAVGILEPGIAVAAEHELRYYRNRLLLDRAEARALLARWDDAVADLVAVLAEPDLSATNRCIALLHLGRVRARRGDPGAVDALDEALELGLRAGETQLIHPIRIARAEAAALAGQPEQARAEIEALVPLGRARPEPWNVAALALWGHRTRVAVDPSGPIPDAIARVLAGDLLGAAALLADGGCAYDAADVLADSDEIDHLRRAHEELVALGAAPRARQAARRLRELGGGTLARGPRATTRANRAGLTRREVEVASLLAGGLTNAAIAERLVLSTKTVDHHVSAVLSKLGIRTRREVARAAADHGVALEDASAHRG